jgi:hypothetical protein
MRLTTGLLAVASCVVLAGCSNAVAGTPTADPKPPPVTVHLHVASGLDNTQIRYTCSVGKTCGPERLGPDGVSWSKVVQLPAGTVVRIAVTAPDSGRVLSGMRPQCVIADDSDRVTLSESSTGLCAVELR